MQRWAVVCLCLTAMVPSAAVALADSTTQSATASERLSLRTGVGGGGRRQLTLMRGAAPLASVPLPNDLDRASIDEGLASAVWNDAGTAVAVAFVHPRATCVVAFLPRDTREYVGTDISDVEARNVGAIGPFRTYVRRATVPLSWEEWSEGRRVLRVRTTVWDQAGQRYRGTEALVFSPDGVPFWR